MKESPHRMPQGLRLAASIPGRLVGAACLALALGAGAHAADDEAWPTRPVRLIVAGAAAGSVDNFARLFAAKLDKAIGQTIIVENRPGGNGTIGARALASAKPDGYTLLFAGNSAMVLNPLTVRDAPYDPDKDFAMVGQVVEVPFGIAVNPKSPIKTLPELLASSGKQDTFFATPGSVSISRLIGEWLNQKSGTRFVNVPYSTSVGADNDVIAGNPEVLIDALSGMAGHVAAGKLRLLAVSSASRLKAFPDVPTISEVIPGFVVPGVNAIVAPAGTPEKTLEFLNQKMREVAKDPELAQRYELYGAEPAVGSREDLTRLYRDQRKLFGDLMKQASIQPE